jgi:hypothetical protein
MGFKLKTPKIGIKVPKIKAPKIKAPKINLPKIKLPEVKAPKIKAPKISIPKIKLRIPNISVPKIRLGPKGLMGSVAMAESRMRNEPSISEYAGAYQIAKFVGVNASKATQISESSLYFRIGRKDLKNGMSIEALERKSDGLVVVSVLGTDDLWDVLSDLGILEGELKSWIGGFARAVGQELFQKKKIEENRRTLVELALGSKLAGKIDQNKHIRNLKSINLTPRPSKLQLGRQIRAASKFVGELGSKKGTNGELIGPDRVALVGGSLGGYIAQCVGYERRLRTVTFNAPGARGRLKPAKNPTYITNHIRYLDIVGNFGSHAGTTVRYPNLDAGEIVGKSKLGNLKDFFVRNHEVADFYLELKDGMMPTKQRMIGLVF